MKIYVVTAETYDEYCGSKTELFGVFSTEKKASKRAREMKLDNPAIHITTSVMDMDEKETPSYLGGTID